MDKSRYAKACCADRKAFGGGILEIQPKCRIETMDDLSTAYTPGVAEPCRRIHADPSLSFEYTIRRHTIAVISDGSAVLGLGNIGPMAALPVMEGKSVLFKQFGQVDAIPLVVDTQDVDELERFVRVVAPTFGGINLEDISAPRCVELTQRLQDLGIPVFHDDQDGTAIVTSAALQNALKVTRRSMDGLRIVINGAGAAGYAIARMLTERSPRPKEILLLDSKGVIHKERENLAFHKKQALELPGVVGMQADLAQAMEGADVFIGVSLANLVSQEMVRSMNPNPILFPMANPDPEILPEDAYEAGAALVGTGRSDYPNQINNVLAFPGIFRGALDARATRITRRMMLAAVDALAGMVMEPSRDRILPKPFEAGIGDRIAKAVREAWEQDEER